MIMNEEKDILQKAINTFGSSQQIIKSIEELGELSTALARYFDKNKFDIDNICEEMVDVEIMLEQLKIIFKDEAERMDHYKAMKLNRLKGVIW